MWNRKPVVAGSFYPSSPDRLKADIEGYINDAEKKDVDSEIIALISPHAGYVYSGPVAAYSFVQLMNSDIEVAVILAPSHRERFDGASLIPGGVYETPLGDMDIDTVIGEKLIEESNFSFIKEVHMNEHSLEVQVPFLKYALDGCKIVPIIVGSVNIAMCKEIAAGLFNVLSGEKRKFIIIISTDLSHYLSYEDATKIDNVFIDNLKKFDVDILHNTLSKDRAQACGAGPVLVGLSTSKELGAKRIEILKYANSGDTAGDRSQVVGYLSAAIVM